MADKWWIRKSTGKQAIAPGWWWVSSLTVRDSVPRLFWTWQDAMDWANEHHPLIHARRWTGID